MERALDSRHQAQPAAGGAAAPPVLSAVIAVLNEAENIEAVKAFIEKRDPDFRQFRK